MNGRDLSEVRALIRRFAQAKSAALTAFAGLSGTGLVAKTGTGTYAARTITSTDTSVTITNPGGVAGNIDLSVVPASAPIDLLGTITTTSGSSQSLTSLNLTPYKFLRLVFSAVSGNTASWVLSIDGVVVAPALTAAQVMRGVMDIDLTDGVFVSSAINAGNNASNVATTYAGDNNITTATTTVTATIAPGTFDNGSIRVYGIR